MQYKILIVDDERDITEMLAHFFVKKGYDVLTAGSGEEAIEKAGWNPDVLLLDIAMPGMDGIELCMRIRESVSCPILFLTARVEDTDKVAAFAAGGDDYVVKPFSLVELEARIQAHLRREMRRQGAKTVRLSPELSINYVERSVWINGEPLALAKKEFDIVQFLSQNAGQVFDKERIYERVWGYEGEGESSVVAEHIRRIRQKMAERTSRVYIQTVWGCGYKWIRP